MLSLTRLLGFRSNVLRQSVRLCTTEEKTVQVPEKKEHKLVSIEEALTDVPIGTPVHIQGWIKSLRKMKTVCFLDVTDRISKRHVQIALSRAQVEDMRLTVGTSVWCKGELVESPGEKQKVELFPQAFDVISICAPEQLPYDLSHTSYAWDTLRHSFVHRPLIHSMKCVLRIRSSVIVALYQFLASKDYINITTPVITGNNCEGGSDVFAVNACHTEAGKLFFDHPAYLTVSGQLHLEAMLLAFGKVFTISPAFRAENQRSRRHVSEFTMLEVEEAFIDNMDHLMDRVEEVVRFIANHIVNNCPEELDFLLNLPAETMPYKNFERITSPKPFIRMTYEEALKIISKKEINADALVWGDDLKRFHEQVLTDYFEGYPIFITNYPSELKPFYMKRDERTALCFDLICPTGGEVAGGSLREDDADVLQSRIEKMGQKESLDWYVDLRRHGHVPHAGFGLGLDRLLQTVLRIQNVRDVIPFPRWSHFMPQ